MKKIIIALILFTSMNLKAQEIGGGVAILNLDGVNLTGFNLSVKKEIKEKVRAGVNLSYFTESGVTLMPISGLIEYKFNTDKLSPFAGVEAGIYRTSFSIFGVTASTSNIGFAPVCGFDYTLTDKINANVTAKYHYIMVEGGSMTALGVNIGIAYKL
jgi:opacity protein-like surface antigen